MDKRCKYCGKLLSRKVGKDGILEYPSEFEKRQFCGVFCAIKFRRGVERVKFNCKNCGKEFYDYASNRKQEYGFCSRKCSAIYNSSKPKPKCKVCGKEVNQHRNIYCSHKCRGKSERSGMIVNCCICNKEFYLPLNRIQKTKQFYCSHECRKRDYDKLLEGMRLKLREIRSGGEETFPEKVVREILIALEVEFERERNIGKYFIDFFIPKLNLCIEIDGDYWHGNKATDKYIGNKNQEYTIRRDIEKREYLLSQGYKLIRFWETDIKNRKENIYANIKRAIQQTT